MRANEKGALTVVKHLLIDLLREDAGQGLVEYALMISLVALVAYSAIVFLGARNKNSLSNSGRTLPG
jgi:Flp pilus assembly pilin Flp